MKKYIPLIISIIHVCISFFTDTLVFDLKGEGILHNYIPCKLLMLVFLYLFWSFIISGDRGMLKYCLIYLIPIAAVLAFKLPQGFLSNDERLIFEQASALADYTWFYYLTTWYYIVCMMIIPSFLGPIIVKVVIQVLMCGYCVNRFSLYLKDKKYGAFLYLGFLLPPILAYTTSAHRIPVYIYLYLLLAFKMLMDKLEKKDPSKKDIIMLLFLIAVLTQWRTEGIYLALFGPCLLFIAYPAMRKDKRTVITVCLLSLLAQYIVSVPQYGFIPSRMNDKAENRMGPFYAYTVTNMFRNGLDLEKNAADIKQVDRYIDVETIKALNDYLGDTNYEDTLILYYPGYTGLRPEASDEDYRAYTAACKNLMINNPGVLMKTKLGSFDYAATVYDIKWEEGGLKGFLKFLVSIVKTLAYNLYAPMLLLLLLFVYAIIKRRPYTFLMTLGLFAHFAIVFALAPASYFKYYFPVYFTVYFWYLMIIIESVYRRYHPEHTGSVTA